MYGNGRAAYAWRAHCVCVTGHIQHCVCVLLDRSHGLIVSIHNLFNISKAPTTCQVRSVAAAQLLYSRYGGQRPVFHSIPVQSSPVQSSVWILPFSLRFDP